ncbi:hypothetical protein [Allostreptomyces psammosilenae]|uniref:Uncharacterized protein n=1 Tax=Allostreptomyces psammosilenae TaxID=1892865 RepID=A0A852ZWC5_9ACTN|nr:hypothetical protein [Allostreptomyces psammosilenae]NYI06519.1 hypothetical protein [Allostreptomyces psammosilenae]
MDPLALLSVVTVTTVLTVMVLSHLGVIGGSTPRLGAEFIPVPQPAQDAAAHFMSRGDEASAIKDLRARTDLELEEAHAAVQLIASGRRLPFSPEEAAALLAARRPDVASEIVRVRWERGDARALKLLRTQTGTDPYAAARMLAALMSPAGGPGW